MSDVPRIALATPLPDPTTLLAEALEAHAKELRAGTLIADCGVLVLANTRNDLMHEPVRMGISMRTSEAMGLLAFGQAHLFAKGATEA